MSADRTRRPPEKGRVPAKTPLVLVVDDYQDAREMCAEYLRFSGFRVEEATDGVEAIEKATRHRPDVILMDLSLPRLDGWEATRRLKKDGRTREIPVIALTGHALSGHSEGAVEAGCDAFLTKPCLPDEMLAQVRRVLSRSEASATADGGDPAQAGPRTIPRKSTANRRSNKR